MEFDKNQIITCSIIILLLFLIIKEYCGYKKTQIENLVNIKKISEPVKWNRNKCKYVMSSTFSDVLNENNIKHSNDNWNLYFPCIYDNINGEISKIQPKPQNSSQRFFIVNNADQLTAKDALWKNIVSYYNRRDAAKIMPNSYILYDKNDLKLLESEFDSNKIYILKKNIQRQEGLKLTNDLNTIINGYTNGYVIVQELLQDPYTIKGRKINLRIYVLLVCQHGDMTCYVYNDGFMYYTKTPFEKHSLDWDSNITTGYVERWIYDVHPLTHNDYRKYLDDKNRKFNKAEKSVIYNKEKVSDIVFNRIYNLITKTMISMSTTVCQGSHLQEHLTFQLFGLDMAVNYKLEPMIIEVNKGPDLSKKDERDGSVKVALLTDMLTLLKASKNGNSSNYIKLFETDGNSVIKQIYKPL
jgi:hypothetical protein